MHRGTSVEQLFPPQNCVPCRSRRRSSVPAPFPNSRFEDMSSGPVEQAGERKRQEVFPSVRTEDGVLKKDTLRSQCRLSPEDFLRKRVGCNISALSMVTSAVGKVNENKWLQTVKVERKRCEIIENIFGHMAATPASQRIFSIRTKNC